VQRLWARFKNIAKEESGQALVLTAIGMVAMLSFVGLAIDVGMIRYEKRHLQSAADAAALAAALETSACGGSSNCSAMQGAAKQALIENGYSASSITVRTQCGTPATSGITLILNNGPCALGSASRDPNYGNTQFVESVLVESQNTIFARLFGVSSMKLSSRSEAGGGSSPNCLYLSTLNNTTSAGTALTMNGSASITSACGIVNDSGSNTALMVNSGSTLTAPTIAVHGGMLDNGATINGSTSSSPPDLTLHAAVQTDPLSSLTPPSTGGCTYNNYLANSGTVTLNPGTYCGGMTFNSNVHVTFNPGTYVVTGSMIMNGGVNATGTGVMFYFPSGSLTMNGSSHASLVAPTTGTYAGILFFQNTSNSSTMILNGDTTSKFQGAIYIPAGSLTLNGGSNLAAYTIVDADSIMVNSGVHFNLGADYSSLPGGSPVKGGSAVLME
jgi:Flp pilus assembly protein TadG